MAVDPAARPPGTDPSPAEPFGDDTVTVNGFQKKLTISVDGKNIMGKLRSEGKLAEIVDKIQNLLQNEYFGSGRQLGENESAKIKKEKGVIFDNSGAECHTFDHVKDGKETEHGKIFAKIDKLVQDVMKTFPKEEKSETKNSGESLSGAASSRPSGFASSADTSREEDEAAPTKTTIESREGDSKVPSKPLRANISSSSGDGRLEEYKAQLDRLERQGDKKDAEKIRALREKIQQVNELQAQLAA